MVISDAPWGLSEYRWGGAIEGENGATKPFVRLRSITVRYRTVVAAFLRLHQSRQPRSWSSAERTDMQSGVLVRCKHTHRLGLVDGQVHPPRPGDRDLIVLW